jgi:hypothetical protein
MQSDPVSPTSDSESSHIRPVAGLPASLASERRGKDVVVRFARPQQRNAPDSETVSGVERLFSATPETAVRHPRRTSRDVAIPWRYRALRFLIRCLYP